MALADAPIVTVGARVPRDVRDELDKLVKSTGRNRNALVEEALRRFIDVERWQLADIEAGLHEADAGDFATDEEMEAMRAKYRAYRTTGQRAS